MGVARCVGFTVWIEGYSNPSSREALTQRALTLVTAKLGLIIADLVLKLQCPDSRCTIWETDFYLLELESWPPATGLRKPKSPKVPGRVLGRVPGKRGLLGDCWEQCRFSAFPNKPASQHCSQQSPQRSPFSRHSSQHSPGTFGDLGFLSPVAGRWDSKSSADTGKNCALSTSGFQTAAQYWIKIVYPSVQKKFFPVLGLESAGRLPKACPDSSSVLDKFQSATVRSGSNRTDSQRTKLARFESQPQILFNSLWCLYDFFQKFRFLFSFLRGPQILGGQISRGWIWRFGAPRLSVQRPQNPLKIGIWGPLGWKSGRPRSAKSYHDGSSPPLRPADFQIARIESRNSVR